MYVYPFSVPRQSHAIHLRCLLLGDDDAIQIDPGWDSQAGMDHLTAGLRQAGIGFTGLNGPDVTHYTSDHLGMAARLRAASAARLRRPRNTANHGRLRILTCCALIAST